ncbi:ATP-binding protein [Streptomyces sp. NPDC090306]|uniref:ATP-binding protein n=1 Tax=Streptomyces sp. NPDC090306 TaxID=3365961 RepID=UPI003823A72E
MPAGARLERRLPRADLCAVAGARRALRDFLRHRVASPVLETAELLTSELVTNALVHTEHDAVLAVTLTARKLRVEVRDFAAHRPSLRGPADDGTHGRGLILVQALADAWGVSAHAVGKSVWYELAADAA